MLVTRGGLRWLTVSALCLGVVTPAGAGTLRGRVLLGDKPASGTIVSAVPYEAPLDEARREARRLPPPPPLASAAAGADGTYVLTAPAVAGKETLFSVRIEGPGVAAAELAGPWEAAESADLGDHVLTRGGALTGKVTDAAGTPVADAEVVLLAQLDRGEGGELEAAARRTRTGADGNFVLDGASAAGNTLTVEKAGLLVARLTGLKGGALRAPIVLGTGAPVSGVVRAVGGAAPAAGTLVRLEGHVTTHWVETAENGTFAIANAPAGVFTVVADAGEAGYLEQNQVRLPLAQGNTLALVLQPASTLVGRTLDAKTDRPVPRTRIEVRAAGKARTTRSGADGAFTLRPLPPRSWQVRADEARYVPWTHAGVIVRTAETKKLDIPLVLGAAIAGRVTDEDGKPIADARGTLEETGGPVLARIVRRVRRDEPPAFRTRTDGTFSASRLAPGESQILTVAHPEYERATVGGVTLVPGATKSGHAIVLKRGAVVTGVVKDANGQPVAGADLALAQPFRFAGGPGRVRAVVGAAGGPGADSKGGVSGADGTFAIHGVAPGEYALNVTRAGYAAEQVDPVKVPETGAPAPLEVTLTPGATISGRVARRSGVGAEGFFVAASAAGRPRFDGNVSLRQPTGSDGSFAIDGLKPGQSYDLQLFGPVGMAEGKRGIVAPAADVEITVAGFGRIAGTALDARDGHPLTDFQVAYEPDRTGGGGRVAMFVARGSGGGLGQPVAVQSADGSFALEEVPAGTWSVVVTAKGYQTARAGGVTVEEGGSTGGVEVRAAKGLVVKGRVTDATNGAAVANATIVLSQAGAAPGPALLILDAGNADITSDADGRFEAEGVAPGKQTLHVTHPDYTEATQAVEVGDEGASVEVRLTGGGVVAGVVTSSAGQPVPGANVTLAQAGAGGGGGGFALAGGAGAQASVTDPSGQFRFDHLGAGRFTATAALGSHTSVPVDVVLQAGQSQTGVALQLQLGVTIQGTVSGIPSTMISGMTVSANGADSYTQTTRLAAEGRFEFDNVPVGVVTLHGTATDPSGSTRSTTKQIDAAGDQPIVTTELVFDQGFTLSGRVTQVGEPIAGATVFANLQGGGGRQASATSDSGGAYQLIGLQAGTYTVNAMSALALSGVSKRQTVTLSADQTLDIAFPSAKIAGQVVDADGNLPLANASVTIASQEPGAGGGFGQRAVMSDSNGQFSFTGLDEGSYTLSTSRPDYQLDKRDTAAADQAGGALVIALKRGAGIGIKVLDGIVGVPLPGVMVRVFDSQNAPVFGPSPLTLDGNGVGEIPALPPGSYTVIAAASSYAPVSLAGVNVPSPTVTIPLTPGGSVLIQAGAKTLATGTATGTITSAAGVPALLSLLNLQGRIAMSEPNLQLRNVPPGSYVLSFPTVSVSATFTVQEGSPTLVKLP
jgi:hypothetical protein